MAKVVDYVRKYLRGQKENLVEQIVDETVLPGQAQRQTSCSSIFD